MSVTVHLHVAFRCEDPPGLAALASRHLPAVDRGTAEGSNVNAAIFLGCLSQQKCFYPGPTGGMILWGSMAKTTGGEQFAKALRPFWKDLFATDPFGGPEPDEHILIFYQYQYIPSASAIEIYLEGGRYDGKLV